MCEQLTLQGTSSAISSPASADGPPPCGWLGGKTIGPSGRDRPPASPSASPESAEASKTSGTSGQRSAISFASVALQSSLESRLRRLMDGHGSTLYRLTWKTWGLPSGRRICALRASVLRTSGSGCTGWPTPTTRDGKDGKQTDAVPINGLVGRTVWLAGWPTPTAADSKRGGGTIRPEDTGYPLPQRAGLWTGYRTSGVTPNGCTAEARATASPVSGDRLNADLSRWLMGFPAERTK